MIKTEIQLQELHKRGVQLLGTPAETQWSIRAGMALGNPMKELRLALSVSGNVTSVKTIRLNRMLWLLTN